MMAMPGALTQRKTMYETEARTLRDGWMGSGPGVMAL